MRKWDVMAHCVAPGKIGARRATLDRKHFPERRFASNRDAAALGAAEENSVISANKASLPH